MANARTPRAPKAKEPKAPVERTFQLAQSDDGEDAVTRVSVGASPRISIGAGQTFTTTDPRLADRLAAQPEFEEVTR